MTSPPPAKETVQVRYLANTSQTWVNEHRVTTRPGIWWYALDTQHEAKKQRLEQLVSLASLHRADAHRLLGESDAMTEAMEGVGPWCLHPLFAEVVQLSAGHSGRASWSSLGEKFEEQGCAHGSELVGQVLTAHAADPVPPQPDLRLTFL